MSTAEHAMNWSNTAIGAFDVIAGEFVVVTADGADLRPYAPLSALLSRVRRAFGLEVAFISEWASGDPIVRSTALCTGAGTDHGPCVQTLYGMQLLGVQQAAASEEHFASVAVITADAMQYGTLCCRVSDDDVRANSALQSVARLIADWFDDAELSLSGLMPLNGHSMMGGLSGLAPLAAY